MDCSKSDVMNLLQSAGFSRSNPYYIVAQGRVTALCNAKDSDRLALLKEVAGTRVYEEHRSESLKIMEETERKREKIVELLAMINDRLIELEGEKGELEQFLAVDKERKACEYTVYSRQLADCNQAIDRLAGEEKQVLATLEHSDQTRASVEAQLAQLQSIEAELQEGRGLLEEAIREKGMGEMERDDLLRMVTQLELNIRTCDSTNDNEAQLDRRLKDASDSIAQKERELVALQGQMRLLSGRQSEIKQEMDSIFQHKQSALSKQTRWAQFKNASERDKWIRQETAALSSTIELCSRQLATLQEESKSAEARTTDLRQVLTEKQRAEAEFRSTQSSLLAAFKSVKEKREEVIEARKDGWRAEAKLEQTMRTVGEEMERWTRALSLTMDRATFIGLQSLPKLAEKLGLSGKVYGMISGLFTCDSVFRTAVESVAGSSLFHMVVEDEETAIALMDGLARDHLGRLTFMPLRHEYKQMPALPTIDDSVAVPLLTKLQFMPQYAPIMGNLFGRYLLVPELAANTMAAQYDMDLVTLSGDRQSRRGLITGGFLDPRRSRLEAVCKLEEWRTKEVTCRAQLAAVRSKLSALEHSAAQLTTQLHLLERQQSAQSHAKELADVERDLEGAEEIVQLKRRTICGVEQRIAAMRERIESLDGELKGPLRASSDDDAVARMERQMADLLAIYENIANETSTLAASQSELKAQIARLKESRTDILERLAEMTKISSETESMNRYSGMLRSANEGLLALAAQIDDHAENVRRLEETAERTKSSLSTIPSNAEHRPMIEKFLSKRSHLISQRDEFQRHLLGIGVISEESVARYGSLATAAVLDHLHRHSDTIRARFPHVNRRAREQHAQYTKQGEELMHRKEELDASAGSISDFIRSLDTKKEEAILRTFSQVSEAFSGVLKELGACGRLEIAREDTSIGDDDVGDIGEFVGMSVNMTSFGAGDEDAGDSIVLKQLSGGQKSLVAISLILAIQRVDPAPFYLFDEMDAALDAAHRTSLARLLSSSAGAQYIITTFRPELVHIGDVFWGVTGGGAAGSRVDAIAKETAVQFIEHTGH